MSFIPRSIATTMDELVTDFHLHAQQIVVVVERAKAWGYSTLLGTRTLLIDKVLARFSPSLLVEIQLPSAEKLLEPNDDEDRYYIDSSEACPCVVVAQEIKVAVVTSSTDFDTIPPSCTAAVVSDTHSLMVWDTGVHHERTFSGLCAYIREQLSPKPSALEAAIDEFSTTSSLIFPDHPPHPEGMGSLLEYYLGVPPLSPLGGTRFLPEDPFKGYHFLPQKEHQEVLWTQPGRGSPFSSSSGSSPAASTGSLASTPSLAFSPLSSSSSSSPSPLRRFVPDTSSPLFVSPKDVFPVLDAGGVSIDDDSDSEDGDEVREDDSERSDDGEDDSDDRFDDNATLSRRRMTTRSESPRASSPDVPLASQWAHGSPRALTSPHPPRAPHSATARSRASVPRSSAAASTSSSHPPHPCPRSSATPSSRTLTPATGLGKRKGSPESDAQSELTDLDDDGDDDYKQQSDEDKDDADGSGDFRPRRDPAPLRKRRRDHKPRETSEGSPAASPQHIPRTADGIWLCPEGCGMVFSRASDAARHARSSAHSQTKVPCPYCNKMFSRSDAVKRHIKQDGCKALAAGSAELSDEPRNGSAEKTGKGAKRAPQQTASPRTRRAKRQKLG